MKRHFWMLAWMLEYITYSRAIRHWDYNKVHHHHHHHHHHHPYHHHRHHAVPCSNQNVLSYTGRVRTDVSNTDFGLSSWRRRNGPNEAVFGSLNDYLIIHFHDQLNCIIKQICFILGNERSRLIDISSTCATAFHSGNKSAKRVAPPHSILRWGA